MLLTEALYAKKDIIKRDFVAKIFGKKNSEYRFSIDYLAVFD